jgi:hypothetical protein
MAFHSRWSSDFPGATITSCATPIPALDSHCFMVTGRESRPLGSRHSIALPGSGGEAAKLQAAHIPALGSHCFKSRRGT